MMPATDRRLAHKPITEKARLERERLPSDDAIWRGRARPWATWEALVGVPRQRLAAWFRRRGFSRGRKQDRIRTAPCAGVCGQRLPAGLLSDIRLCTECGEGTPQELARRERRAFLERRADDWLDSDRDLDRVYTPGAPRGRPNTLVFGEEEAV